MQRGDEHGRGDARIVLGFWENHCHGTAGVRAPREEDGHDTGERWGGLMETDIPGFDAITI